MKNEVRESLERQDRQLQQVFAFASDDQRSMTKSRYLQVMSKAFPKLKSNYLETVWFILDPESKLVIAPQNMTELLEILKLRHIDVTPRLTFFEGHFPRMYGSTVSKTVVQMVRHKRFRNVFDFAIVLNAIFIGADLDKQEYFLALFSLEIALKMYAFGIQAFFRKMWNVFDTVVVGSAIVVSVIHLAEEHFQSGPLLDFIMILRVLRIFKVFHGISRFKIVLNTLISILPRYDSMTYANNL